MPCVGTYTAGVGKPASSIQLGRSFQAAYLVVILKYYGTYNAVIPDVPGCVATSTSLSEVRELITRGLELHLPKLLSSGGELPQAMTRDYSQELGPEDEVVEYGEVRVKGEAEY